MNKSISFKNHYPRISILITLLFCAYVVIWYLQIGERWPKLGAIRIEFLIAALLFVLALIVPIENKFSRGNGLYPYVAIYFLFLLVQIPFSRDVITSWNIFINWILKFSAMAFFIIVFVKSPFQLKLFIGAFMLACMKIGQEGFTGAITGSMIWENQGVMRLHGANSLISHPNSLAGNALGTIPFIFFLFPVVPLILKIPLVLQAIFALNIIVHTGSRTGYLGFISFLLFVPFIRARGKIVAVIVILLLLVIGAFSLPGQYKARFESIFTLEEKQGHSAERRIEILRDAWEIFKDNPFGIGVGSFPSLRMKTFGRYQDTHNLYLGVAVDLGIQGLIAFILLVFKMLKTLNEIRKKADIQLMTIKQSIKDEILPEEKKGKLAEHIGHLRLIRATSLSVLLFVIIRLIVGVFGMDLYQIYWWFALGLTISLFNIQQTSEKVTAQLIEQYGRT